MCKSLVRNSWQEAEVDEGSYGFENSFVLGHWTASLISSPLISPCPMLHFITFPVILLSHPLSTPSTFSSLSSPWFFLGIHGCMLFWNWCEKKIRIINIILVLHNLKVTSTDVSLTFKAKQETNKNAYMVFARRPQKGFEHGCSQGGSIHFFSIF